MNKIRLLLLSAGLLTLPALADTQADSRDFTSLGKEVSREIDVTERSLKNSSITRYIDKDVMDKSISLLARAREELANGNLKTARELNRRAAQPMTLMDEDAMNGKHPDPVAYKLQVRDTLASLLPVASAIAAKKGASDQFVRRATAALAESDALLAQQKYDQAREVLEQAYDKVQQSIVALRSGDSFYLQAPQTLTADDWLDGLRRVEERRAISQYLLLEAQYDGVDVRDLKSGLQAAEETVARANRLASEKRWEPALKTLELSYVQFEESWRAAGVEW